MQDTCQVERVLWLRAMETMESAEVMGEHVGGFSLDYRKRYT